MVKSLGRREICSQGRADHGKGSSGPYPTVSATGAYLTVSTTSLTSGDMSTGRGEGRGQRRSSSPYLTVSTTSLTSGDMSIPGGISGRLLSSSRTRNSRRAAYEGVGGGSGASACGGGREGVLLRQCVCGGGIRYLRGVRHLGNQGEPSSPGI